MSLRLRETRVTLRRHVGDVLLTIFGDLQSPNRGRKRLRETVGRTVAQAPGFLKCFSPSRSISAVPSRYPLVCRSPPNHGESPPLD